MVRAIRGASIFLAAVALLAAACGGGQKTTVKVSDTEWNISPAVTQAKAGKVAFEVTNDGKEPHEFIVVRSDAPVDGLPVANGQVNEDAVEIVGNVEPFEPGKHETVSVNLSPGRYLLICNVKEGGVSGVPLVSHYANGMRTAFVVTE